MIDLFHEAGILCACLMVLNTRKSIVQTDMAPCRFVWKTLLQERNITSYDRVLNTKKSHDGLHNASTPAELGHKNFFHSLLLLPSL